MSVFTRTLLVILSTVPAGAVWLVASGMWRRISGEAVGVCLVTGLIAFGMSSFLTLFFLLFAMRADTNATLSSIPYLAVYALMFAGALLLANEYGDRFTEIADGGVAFVIIAVLLAGYLSPLFLVCKIGPKWFGQYCSAERRLEDRQWSPNGGEACEPWPQWEMFEGLEYPVTHRDCKIVAHPEWVAEHADDLRVVARFDRLPAKVETALRELDA